MSKDNEPREDVKRYLVRKGREYRDKTGRYSRIAVPINRGLVDDLTALIKQHTEKRAASELEAIRSAMTEFAKMGDREWFSIAGLKYINDRLNQLKKEK